MEIEIIMEPSMVQSAALDKPIIWKATIPKTIHEILILSGDLPPDVNFPVKKKTPILQIYCFRHVIYVLLGINNIMAFDQYNSRISNLLFMAGV